MDEEEDEREVLEIVEAARLNWTDPLMILFALLRGIFQSFANAMTAALYILGAQSNWISEKQRFQRDGMRDIESLIDRRGL